MTSKLLSFQNSIKVPFNSYIIWHYGKIYIGVEVASVEVLFTKVTWNRIIWRRYIILSPCKLSTLVLPNTTLVKSELI